jgi:hypothetical protein
VLYIIGEKRPPGFFFGCPMLILKVYHILLTVSPSYCGKGVLIIMEKEILAFQRNRLALSGENKYTSGGVPAR